MRTRWTPRSGHGLAASRLPTPAPPRAAATTKRRHEARGYRSVWTAKRCAGPKITTATRCSYWQRWRARPAMAARRWSSRRPRSAARRPTNQAAREVLGGIDLDGATVTADALHTVKATAELIHQRGGQFVFPVKENRQALFDALDALPWKDIPITHHSVDKGHGRITRRTIRVLPAPDDLPFPHVNQAYLVERYVTATDGTPISAVAALGVASHTATQATPADLACYVQGQWAVEVLHWIRDTLYREDNSTVRTRSGPRIMASLRNLAIGALRLAGRRDITEATRWANRYMTRPFTILALTS